MAKIDEKFIVNLQEKQFVTYEGLLDLAHQKGLKGIETELIQTPNKENNNTCIVKAIAKLENGEFYGIGDANPSNVGAFVSKHIIRMAETRAKARALRDLTNVGMTAIEELGDDTEDKPSGKYSNNKKTATKQSGEPRMDEDKQAIVDGSLATDKQLRMLYALTKEKGFESMMGDYIKKTYDKDSSKALTKAEASEIIKMLQDMK